MSNADKPATGFSSEHGRVNGLTKREYFVAAAMQGLCVNMGRNGLDSPSDVAKEAVRQANAALNELGEF